MSGFQREQKGEGGGGFGKPFQPKRAFGVRECRRPGVHWLREGLNGGERLILES